MNNEVLFYFICFYVFIYPLFLYIFVKYMDGSGWNSGAHSKIPSKVRALPRFRESRPRHLGSRGQRQRRAFSTFVTFYPKNRPTTYSRSCTSKIHYLYLYPPTPLPPLNHRGHCWVGVGVKYNSKSPPPCHHLLTFHNLYCAVSLSLSLSKRWQRKLPPIQE